ncbi:hypothetical protein AB0957_01045 [Streptomyces zhihengii]|uniref:hypothetical protein n=1 Tax=Streptomyces zhihengii TaxID=1818004 RepID=UPI003451138D
MSLYDRMRQGALAQDADTPGLDELVHFGLIVDNVFKPGAFLLADPFQAWRHNVVQQRAALEGVAHRLTALERLFATLPVSSEPAAAGITYLASKDEANGAITKALGRARRFVYTAHPMTRTKRTMELSLPRDIEYLDRGLALRTIYTSEARTRSAEGDWAKQVTSRGAEVRTLKGRFHRMVLIDDTAAIIADHTNTENAETAWEVEHPGLLAFLAEVYADQWRRADPWLGGREDNPKAGTLTTPMTRSILRGMGAGRTQAAIATDLGVSRRTLTNHLTKLYELLGYEPGDQFRLGKWWATSPESSLD